MTAIAWTLRPANVEDRDFLFALNRAAMGPYIEATWGWDEAVQMAYFDEHFEPSRRQIIQVESIEVGELAIEQRPGELYVARVALLPSWGRGIGSAIIGWLIDRARELEAAVVLEVLKTNPRATRLYESLGFERTGETATNLLMRLDPKL